MSTGIVSPSAGPGGTFSGTPHSGGGGMTTRALKVLPSWVRNATTQALNQTYMLNIQLVEIDGTLANYHRLIDEVQLDVDDTTLNNTDRHLPVWAVENRVKFKAVPYDSTTATTIAQTGWIEVSINGYLVARLSPKHSIHPNSTGLDFGGTITSAGSKWCGVVCEGGMLTTPTGTASGLPSKAFGARLIRPQASVTPPTSPGLPDIVAFTPGQVDVGTLGVDQTLTACTATASALTGREVQAVSILTTITAIVATPRSYVLAVDGTTCRIIDPIGKTITNWTNTTGVSPFETCRIIGYWRGRVFLANYDGNPTYWALSKIIRAADDVVSATLWTTGGSDPTRAFAGTASDSPGVPATAVTAFAELDNGRAFMGCAGECFIFDGDPGYGGRLLKVSGETGCLGPRALAFDEEGNLYFVGPSGLFMVPRGTTEVRNVSGNRMASVLNRIDTSRTMVQLVYDSLKRALMVFLTPRDGSAGTHAMFETSQNAPWKNEYPAVFGPLGVCKIVGQTPDERRYLIIGSDGYIRRPIAGKQDDDGSAIDWWVKYPILHLRDGSRQLMVLEIQGAAADGTGPVEWQVRTAASPVEVLRQDVDDTAAATGTWFEEGSGFQTPRRIRARGGAMGVCLRQTSASESVAMESVVVQVAELGPRRT